MNDPVMTSALGSFPARMALSLLDTYGYARDACVRAYERFSSPSQSRLYIMNSGIPPSNPASSMGTNFSLEARVGGDSSVRVELPTSSVPASSVRCVPIGFGGACNGSSKRLRRVATSLENVDGADDPAYFQSE
ncbi:MAG: hypothetical protein AABX70_01065 [Nanoarchaeota archaeon]